jgi:phosphate-selective porin OprO/OprP
MSRVVIIIVFCVFWASNSFSQEEEKKTDEIRDFYLKKGKGFEFHFDEDKYMFYIDFRGQFRASYPHNNFPTSEDDFSDDDINMGISRARIKFGGYVGEKGYNFYLEQDVRGGNLLDFRAQIEKLSYLKFRVGQWKARYSRERVISSGKQTGLERSLINRIFTIDRQQGVSLYGNLDGGGAANFNYWAEILTGSGRGGSVGDDDNLMYMMRLQWNPNGKELGFSGSDLKFHEKFVSSVAIAGVTNTSKYTRFSTSGGGQLYGYEPGVDGQYKVDQFLFETAFKYRGLSFDQELHYKNIDDKVNLEETLLIGNYFQVGYFFHYLFEKFPKPLEVFARQAFYDPDTDISGNNNYEYSFGLNWFFKGHKNKLTLDYSYLDFKQFTIDNHTDHMVRIQWDVSIF